MQVRTCRQLLSALPLCPCGPLADSPADPAWETYKMQVYIKQSTDLLLCKVSCTTAHA